MDKQTTTLLDQILRTSPSNDSATLIEELLGASGVGLWDWDLATNEIFATREGFKLLGLSPLEPRIHFNEWLERIHPEDIHRVQATSLELYEGNVESYVLEYRVRHNDGTWLWIRSNGKVIERDTDGKPLRASGCHQNISQLKNINTELEANKQQLAYINRILAAMRDINQLIETKQDPDALLQKACSILVDNGSFHHCMILLTDVQNGRSPKVFQAGLKTADFDAITEHVQNGNIPACMVRALESGGMEISRNSCSECPACPFSKTRKKRTGLAIPLVSDRTVHGVLAVVVPHWFVQGEEQPALIRELAGDLAYALHKLKTKQQERWQNSIINSGRNPVSMVSVEGRYLAVNDAYAKLYNTTINDITGKLVMERIGEERFLKEVKPRLDRALKGKTMRYEVQIDSPTGGLRWMQMEYIPFISNQGSVTAVIAQGTDITERKDQNTRLEQANRELSDSRQAALNMMEDAIMSQKRMVFQNELLEQNEAQFRSYIENAPYGIFITSEDGNYLDVNPAAEQLTGYSRDELLNMRVLDLYPEEPDRRKAEEAFSAMTETGRAHVEIAFRTKHGDQRGWSLSITKLPNDRYIGFAEDITARLEAQRKQEEAKHLLRSIIDSLPSRVWWKDLDNRYLGANIHCAHDMGEKDPDALIGKSSRDVFDAELAESSEADDREVVASGRPKLNIPGMICLANGEVRWMETNKVPLRGEDGQIIGTVGTTMDVSERRKSEEELNRLSTAIEQSPEAIAITDSEGTIQYVNPAFETITGYTREEAMGENPRILKSEEHDDAFYKTLWEIISSGEVWEGRLINKRKDGTLFTEEASISPVKDQSGAIINYVAIKRDISEELIHEEELRQAQKMEAVGQLAGGVAHDFNNILQGILGFSEMLRFDLDKTSQAYDQADEIHNAALRAAALTRQLLSFSRKEPMRVEEIDLNQVIRDSEALLTVLLSEKHQLLLDLQDNLPPIHADHSQLTQIIMNLSVNARDAMPDGGRLSISTESVIMDKTDAAYAPGAHPSHYLCLSVTDTGYGMDDKIKNHIFEPFFTTKEVGSGTGLGLSVIYGIVTQNQGWMNVYSEINKGTSFNIFLPVASAYENTIEPETEIDTRARNARILLVEDDTQIRHMVMEVLEDAGYQAVQASSAEDALTSYNQEEGRFDLLMSDMELPGMRGDAFADVLRSMNPNLPVLLFSGYRDHAERWKHLADKGYLFMNKPFTTVILLDTVIKLIKENIITEEH